MNIYLTTSIPYLNAAPHVGHAQEFILSDALARLYRLAGHQVKFQTGTDENAFKNVASAQDLGIAPIDFVNRNAEKFRRLDDDLRISYDTFLRTTEERHHRGVQKLWRALNPQDLFSKSYRGLYCQGCEDFYLEKDLVEGLCPDHRKAPHLVEEENLFFKLSRYQTRLDELISNDQIRIVPEFRKNEVLSFIRHGLQDISLTRDAARVGGWGIAVPDHPRQVVYVWIDALVNYLSGQGYGTDESWREVWNPETRKIHVIGKNVWKFHAVYWPALLLSAGLPLPDEIVIHGFLTIDGLKISKSLGNVVDPGDVIRDFGADSLRHYLLAELSLYQDADFSLANLRSRHNVDLANILGNLVSRLSALAKKAGLKIQANGGQHRRSGDLGDVLKNYDVNAFSQYAWNRLRKINVEIHQRKPWEHLRSDDLAIWLKDWVNELRAVNALLACLIPEAAAEVHRVIDAGIETLDAPLFPRR
jgi:methionyl-tRNA synthetase